MENLNSQSVRLNNERKFHRIIKLLTPVVRTFTRITIIGEGDIPERGGAILAPNHISNADPIILGVAIGNRRQVKALAKSQLFGVPLIKSVLNNMGHIPVERGTSKASHALAAAQKVVQSEGVVGIYREGTIPQSGVLLGGLKTGVARLAAATHAPVIPVGQWGAQYILPPRQNPAWPLLKALFTRPRHTIVVGKPLMFSDYGVQHRSD